MAVRTKILLAFFIQYNWSQNWPDSMKTPTAAAVFALSVHWSEVHIDRSQGAQLGKVQVKYIYTFIA